MPLSRHFYSLEEVKAALWHCSARSDAIQTVFWCLELIDSGCIGEAVSILFESWVWNHFSTQWIYMAWEKLSSDDIRIEDVLDCAYHLSLSPRDHSIWNILSSLAEKEKPDRVSPKTQSYSSNPIEQCFLRAIHQKRIYTACYVSHFLTKEIVENNIENSLPFLTEYDKLLGFRSEEWDKIILYIRISYLNIPHYKEIYHSYHKHLEQWNSEVGRCKRRHYSISLSYLNHTHRPTYLNTMSHINDIEMNMIGCPFWEESLEGYATVRTKIKWNSNEAMEEWYQRYCPDDIPDEWSLSEKEKSHGSGLIKYHENLFQAFSLYKKKDNNLIYNELHNIVHEITDLSPIPWEPVRRRFILPCQK